jgi:hypothetical protein
MAPSSEKFNLRDIALEVPTPRGVIGPFEVIHLSTVVGATSQKGRGIDYDALRECAGTLCVADLLAELDRLTIFC